MWTVRWWGRMSHISLVWSEITLLIRSLPVTDNDIILTLFQRKFSDLQARTASSRSERASGGILNELSDWLIGEENEGGMAR